MFEDMPLITTQELDLAMEIAVQQILCNLSEFTYKFQKAYSENNFYKPIDNNDWTTGCWTGELWLAYEWNGFGINLRWIITIWDFYIHPHV